METPTRSTGRGRCSSAFATQIFHLGDVGSGATMKLVVNSLVHSLNVAVSEALVLAERAGLDRETTYDVLEASAAGAPFVKYKRRRSSGPMRSRSRSASPWSARTSADPRAGRGGRRADAAGRGQPAAVAEIVQSELGQRDLSEVAVYLRRP